MKLHITTNTELDVSELWIFNIVPTVDKTKAKLRPLYNPYFNQIWGDFTQFNGLKGYDARAFFTTVDDIKAIGITSHLGMYNLVDNDGVLDFYAGVPTKLDKRASSNGFKTNVAWLAVHEMCHGLLQQQKRHDCTHEMEAQGRLQELWFELYEVWAKNKLTLADKLVSLINFLKKPDTLLPEVQRRADRLIKMMEQAGHPIRITETYRTPQRQNELYSQGRTKPGQIVTNARAGESLHQYRVAFDVVFIKEGFNAPSSLWSFLGEVGEGIGLEWGGRWKSFPDKPHLQYTAGYTLSEFQQGKVDYKKFI